MKFIKIFNLLPFNFYIINKNSNEIILKNEKPLFDKINKNRIESFVLSVNSDGWRTCTNDYASYARKLTDDGIFYLIITDLKVKPYWKQQGKTSGLSLVIDQAKIQEYIDSFINDYKNTLNDLNNEIQENIKSFAIENIHEIRSINSSLYNIGYELQEKIQHDSKYNLALSKNIVALSELISTRIDLTDLSISKENNEILKKSPPKAAFKSFEKITRCYTAFAAKRRIKLTLNGESRGQTNGLEYFELIPMIIIDNAVKYSPSDSEVNIEISENETSIFVSVKSWGPLIHESEMQNIFDKNFRGKEAITSKKEGSGIGLYFVKKLLSTINSKISVAQLEESKNSHGKTYFKTNFELSFQRIN